MFTTQAQRSEKVTLTGVSAVKRNRPRGKASCSRRAESGQREVMWVPRTNSCGAPTRAKCCHRHTHIALWSICLLCPMFNSLFLECKSQGGRGSWFLESQGEEVLLGRSSLSCTHPLYIRLWALAPLQPAQLQGPCLSFWPYPRDPLLCKTMSNPLDRGAWQATVQRVTKNWSDLACTHTNSPTGRSPATLCGARELGEGPGPGTFLSPSDLVPVEELVCL